MIFGKYVNRFYKKYWAYFVIGLLALIVVDVVQVFIPRLIGNIVGIFTDAEEAGTFVPDNFFGADIFNPNGFSFFVVAMLSIGVIMFLCRMGWRFALFKLGSSIDFDLRQEMFEHAESLSVSYYKKQKIGSLMSLFNNDLNSIRNSFIDGVIQTIDGFVMGPIVVVMMFTNNWQLALISMVPLALTMVICFVVEKGMTVRYEDQLKAFERLSDFTQESFTGISVIKAFVKEGRNMLDFAKYNKDNRNANMRYLKYSVTLNILIEFLINSVFIIIFFVGVQVILGNPLYKVGNLVEFIGYLDSAIWPFIAMGQVLLVRSRGKAGLKIVTDFLDTKSELSDKEMSEEKPIDGEVEFKNFNFRYPDGENNVLENINLHVKKGQNIGIVGRTGCGKSTLVKVLLKIYNIDDGELFFSGVDINEFSAKYIRSKIGYVAQNAFLFSDLIRNNIAFSDEDINEDSIKSAASFACIDDSITRFKDGYHTLIGEKGTSLSGGQKQRLAMARAIVKNPPILILDDSVSAVDSDTEQKILNNIKTLRQGKTTFIVSSRVSVVENLDAIIVMDKGSIIGCGTHFELMESCKQYRQTVELQQLENEGKQDGNGRVSGSTI